jgi:hypothetical protein
MLKDHYHEYHQVYGQQTQDENEDAGLDIENIPRVLQHCYGRRRRTRTTDEHLDELELYYRRCGNMDVVPENILEWWKCNQDTFPVLSLMARGYLAVPGKNKKNKKKKKKSTDQKFLCRYQCPCRTDFLKRQTHHTGSSVFVEA